MSCRINREELLRTLEAVQPGLSPRLILEQSTCFIFHNGRVETYNDEVACRFKTGLDKEFKGAVVATPLLAVLRKLDEEELDLEMADGELLIVGKKRRSGIKMEAEILLPVDKVERPKEWKTLHEDFTDAMEIVQTCAGKDESLYITTCVHIHPKWIEAFDNTQMLRYKMKTQIDKPTLVKRDNVKHILPLGMTEFAETDSWLHFRNPSGLYLSCRRSVETFPDLTSYFDVGGEPATLPKGLTEAVEKAEIFSAENTDANEVQIQLRPGRLRLKGIGVSGWYSEVKTVSYNGPQIEFLISPKLLQQLVKRHYDVLISEKNLKVDGGKYVYLTCLSQVSDEKEKTDE